METNDNINYQADKGKVFIRKADNRIVGYGLGLAKTDTIANYDEIDLPSEYKGIEGYDNTYEETDDIIVVPSADILRENGDMAEGGSAD
jgi:hypothetical protein